MTKNLNNIKIAIIGMGYVGLPLAVAFAEKGIGIIGFDINKNKILKYSGRPFSGDEIYERIMDEVVNDV